MSEQLCLFPQSVMDGYRKVSEGARGLLVKIMSYARGKKGAIPFQRTLAAKMKVPLRTIQRWVSQLKAAGWLGVKKRQRSSARYTVKVAGLPVENVGSKAGPIIITFEKLHSKEPEEKRSTTPEYREPVKKGVQREVSVTTRPMEGFERFFGLFLAAGKPLNNANMILSQAQWVQLDIQDQIAAYKYAKHQLMRTKDPRFMPLPENFLSAQPWTRTAPERTLPYVDPKADKALDTHEEVLRIMRENRLKESA